MNENYNVITYYINDLSFNLLTSSFPLSLVVVLK